MNGLETHNWIAAHPHALDKYAGNWVAVLKGSVVAYSNTLGELFDKLKGRQTPGLLITRVPKEKKILLY